MVCSVVDRRGILHQNDVLASEAMKKVHRAPEHSTTTAAAAAACGDDACVDAGRDEIGITDDNQESILKKKQQQKKMSHNHGNRA
eukprot:scaffold13_cov137-Skeletonema_menzelii.AAC.6